MGHCSWVHEPPRPYCQPVRTARSRPVKTPHRVGGFRATSTSLIPWQQTIRLPVCEYSTPIKNHVIAMQTTFLTNIIRRDGRSDAHPFPPVSFEIGASGLGLSHPVAGRRLQQRRRRENASAPQAPANKPPVAGSGTRKPRISPPGTALV